MRDETLKALGELAGYDIALSQHDLVDAALVANPRDFEELVNYAKGAPAPIGVLINGCRRIVTETERVSELRESGDAARAEKRVKAAKNYAGTALSLVPVGEQETVMRDECPWITPSLMAECLEIGAKANEWYLADEESLKMGASKPVPKPNHNWPMPRSAFAARFWSDPKNWVPEAGARWCDLPEGHPMKYPLDMPTTIIPAPEMPD